MKWHDTPQSSNIAGFGYDAGTKVLTVSFTAGKTYTYQNVPSTIYKGMKMADSVGSYFQKHVRPNYTGEVKE